MIKLIYRILGSTYLALALSACASTVDVDGDLQPSMLNEGLSRYNETEVTVQGFLVMKPEARQLWESKRKYDAYADEEYCLTLTNTFIIEPNLEEYNFKKIRLKGIFKSDINAGPVIDLGACNDSGLEIIEVMK